MRSSKFLYLIASLFFFSCETPVNLEVNGTTSTKVIEGRIENGQPAVVMVSNALDYYSTIDMQAILNSVDPTCIVRITDEDGNEEQLTTGFDFSSLYGAIGAAYKSKNIVGEPGKTYHLYVEDTAGNIYTATTTIPAQTVWVDSVKFTNEKPTDTAALARIYFQDRAATYDCYRFFCMLKNVDICYNPISLGTYDDLAFNGKYMNYEIIRSPMSNMSMQSLSQEEQDNYYRMYFKKGDTLYVKSTLTDTATYNFWFPLQVITQVGEFPFLSRNAYPTNIQGKNVVGIWSGYHARYDTLIFE